jgi:putative Mg2+ transporter-C (MgtC) family protein
MPWDFLELVWKILLTVVLCGLIGFEREMRHKDAGLRTHILVGVGSALVVLTSFYIFDVYHQQTPIDPTRMIAGIITGIGFLCGGTIIRAGNQVTGLTTAATLWTVSGLGMAVAAGQYVAASLFTLIIIFVLIGVRSFEIRMKNKIT